MEFVDTLLGQFIFKGIFLVIFIALMKGVWASALASMKRSGGKWTSIIDEVIEGFIGVAIFFVVIATPPSQILTFVMTIINFLWGLIAPVLRDYLNLPV